MIPNRASLYQLSLTSLLDQKAFLKDCKKTLELCGKIDSALKGWFIPSIIPVVNSICINLKLPREIKKLNSCLIISPRGTGKSELLEDILAASNPGHFVVLPPKIFESELVQKPRDFFHNKIMVQSDCIVTFEGLSPKQREQHTNFWTKLLEGSYGRERNQLSNVRTMAFFGFASEMLNKFREELITETFLDRVTPFKHEVNDSEKRQILEFRSKHTPLQNGCFKRPIVKLPLPEKIEDDRKVKIEFPYDQKIERTIINFAMELDMYGVQSYARAQDYIKVFMMSNALLNGRRKVTASDLYLYGLVHPLFIKSMHELGTEKLILSLFKQHPDLPDKELIKKSEVSKPTFYKYKKILKRKGLI